MGKGLFTFDNILIIGIAGSAAAYFFDIAGFKETVNQAIDQLMAALKLGNGNVDCTANPTDPSCTGTGGDCSACTTACCSCKCKDRASCPEGTCCEKCRSECPKQCGSAAASTPTSFIPDNWDTGGFEMMY